MSDLYRSFERRTALEKAQILTFVLWLFFGLSMEIVAFWTILIVLNPKTIRQPLVWLTLALMGSVNIITNWHPVDNHKYLLIYWTWLLFFASFRTTPEVGDRIVYFGARFLVSFLMLAALFQKLFSISYLSGDFFTFFIMNDPRFFPILQRLGDGDTVHQARSVYSYLSLPIAIELPAEFVIPASGIALFLGLTLTFANVLFQILIEFFSIFYTGRMRAAFHFCMFVFIFIIYLPAPVIGFGWILCIWGAVIASRDFPHLVKYYVRLMLLLLIYALPWHAVLAD